MASDKMIISCAITGPAHVPTMSDALPATPDEARRMLGLKGGDRVAF